MLFFLTLTQQCNLRCLYCGSSEDTDIEDLLPHPRNITFDFESIKKLAKIDTSKDPEGLIICFYGGEPLLKKNLIEKTFQLLPKETKYCLQTNGTLMKFIKPELINRMDTILISVDGDEKVTDANRGKGTWKKAIDNCNLIRKRGFKGDLVARMTVHKDSDIYRDVTFLLNLKDYTGNYLFDHVHWQLDVMWDTPKYARWDGNFLKWRDNNYNPGISKLASDFVENLKSEKPRILGIAPFLGLLYSFYKGEKSKLRCGSGISAFNVQTGGIITACPIACEYDELAKIEDPNFDPEKLRNRVEVKNYCPKCEIYEDCGGRCLYANKNLWWEEEGFFAVCNTVKHLVKEMRQNVLPVMKELIEKKKFTIEDFHYPPFNNSVEVIP